MTADLEIGATILGRRWAMQVRGCSESDTWAVGRSLRMRCGQARVEASPFLSTID